MLLFAFAVASTVVLLGIVLAGRANRRCRIRCLCVEDSAALVALASVTHRAKRRHDLR